MPFVVHPVHKGHFNVLYLHKGLPSTFGGLRSAELKHALHSWVSFNATILTKPFEPDVYYKKNLLLLVINKGKMSNAY